MEWKWPGRLGSVAVLGLFFLLVSLAAVSSDRSIGIEGLRGTKSVQEEDIRSNYVAKLLLFLWETDKNAFKPVWPPMEFGWKIVVGSMIGFFGAAFGSVGGVGGGGIFVPMLALIVGFDSKSATAMSKCMIMGAAGATVYYNLKLRHPSLHMPVIDFDLALLIQPMLMLGISIGVIFNVVFPDWMVTVLLIVLFIGTSSKALMKGVHTWKLETILKREAAKRLVPSEHEDIEYEPLPMTPTNNEQKGAGMTTDLEVPLLQNIHWKELCLLVFVWMSFLALQIAKNSTATCSTWYWILNFLQIPISISVTLYEGIGLYRGERVIASTGVQGSNLKISQLLVYCLSGVIGGIVGGLLGLGGGFILGPLFLELGIPPQVSSATATFAMTFSSSMSVVEYYLLKRFPVPYAAYFFLVATVAAFVGQHVVRRLVLLIERASLIIFILASTIFISAITLGGFGIINMIEKIENNEYMGFEDLCKYDA